MKYRISAEEYNALPDDMKVNYRSGGNGLYVLQVEGIEDPNRVKEFRDNNIRLQQQVNELQASLDKFKDIDPNQFAEYRDQAKKLKELEDKNLIKAGDLDQVVAQRTETMRQDYERRLNTLQTQLQSTTAERDKFKTGYRNVELTNHLRGALTKAGNLKPGADKMLIREAMEYFELNDEDGSITSKNLFNNKGDPMTPEDWAKSMVTERAFLFEPAVGSGAPGGARSNTGAGAANRGNGKPKTLVQPSAVDFGKNLESIASGETEVILAGGDE